MRRSFTDMDDMLRKKNQPIKRATQAKITSRWLNISQPQSSLI